MDQVAKLAYLNKDHLIFYRGQGKDHENKVGASSFYPSIYRGGLVKQAEINLRFDILTSASRRLCDVLQSEDIPGYADVKRRKYIQWAILQHYEVCGTPLLDFTHSLRVACSFAFLDYEKSTQTKPSDRGAPHVYVFGLPYVTNRISINSEHDIVNIRLLSICPPAAMRPYYQEGYLAGTDEITTEYESKDELDFNNRLIAKFRLTGEKSFWDNEFGAIPKPLLYPENDDVESFCSTIKRDLGIDVEQGNKADFLKAWVDLENYVLTLARRDPPKTYSFRGAMNVLASNEKIQKELLDDLDRLYRLRKMAIHDPQRIDQKDFETGITKIWDVKRRAASLNLREGSPDSKTD